MHTTAAPRRYNINTANKLANTLYFHLILDPKLARECCRRAGNVRPRFVPHGEQEAGDNESRERVLGTVTLEYLCSYQDINQYTRT